MLQTPIAVIGVSALFPGSSDAPGFWRDILAGRDLTSEVPPTHWLIEDYYDPNPAAPDKTYCKRGAFLSPVDFDPLEFGIPPSNMKATDTAQLLALIVAQKLLDDVGESFAKIDRERVSVILGVTSGQELLSAMVSRLQRPVWLKGLRESGIPEPEAQAICERIANNYVPWQEASFPGLLGNVVAGRVASRFDLHGTNCVTDAACASALSALSMAVNELALGQSDLVVTGGVDTMNDILMYMCFSKTPALSPSENCRPFSKSADGTILGEGVGMLALRRLEDAERDGNRIYAVLRGVGSSSDGRSKSIYAPLPAGQARALTRAYERAGYGPETVELVEGHGTGTKAGDAAEFEALAKVFGERDRADRPWCALGSVKSQIGHTKASAGVAGLIKAVLALHHKVLPPTIKIDEPNPKIDVADNPFYLSTETRPWVRAPGQPRRASVSSFGFGGSNFHVTLEEYTSAELTAPRYRTLPSELLLVGASSGSALAARCQELLAAVRERGLVAAAREAQESFDSSSGARLALVANEAEDLATKLEQAMQRILGAPEQAFSTPQGVHYECGEPQGSLAFLFPGQGSQYLGMGAEIARSFEPALAVWDRAAATKFDGLAIHDVVFPRPVFSDGEREALAARLTATEWAQPALAVTSLATLAVLQTLGVRADCVGGHSFGELTALSAAQVFDADSLIAVARKRGELMRDSSKISGAMTAVPLAIDKLRPLIEASSQVVIANHNHPSQVVLSGPLEAIEQIESELRGQGVQARRLQVATAFHSPLVAPACGPFADFLERVPFAESTCDVYSNSEAGAYSGDAAERRKLLALQLSRPVRFVEQIEEMWRRGVRTFVEVGPGTVLSELVHRILEGRPHRTIATERKGRAVASLLEAFGRLAVAGLELDFKALWAPYAIAKPRRKANMAIAIGGANYGKVYPPAGGAAALPPPVPARAAQDKATPAAAAGAASVARVAPAVSPIETKEKHMEKQPSLAKGADYPQSSAGTPSAAAAPRLPVAAPRPASSPKAGANGSSLGLEHAPAAAALRATPVYAEAPTHDVGSAHPALIQVYQDTQRNMMDAQSAYQRSVTESHLAFLKAIEGSYAGLAALVGGAPAVSEPRPDPLHDAAAFMLHVPGQFPSGQFPSSQSLGSPSLGSNGHAATSARSANGSAPAASGAALRADSYSRAPANLPDLVSSNPPAPEPVPVPPRVAEPPPAPAALEAAQPAPAALASMANLQALLITVVAEKTGYPEEMLGLDLELEADLGVDSIKRVEILSAMRERVPNLPEVAASDMAAQRTLRQVISCFGVQDVPAAAHVAPPASGPESSVRPSGSGAKPGATHDLTAVLLQVVAEKTGYPQEMLGLDLELEADLGVDSIKRVEILSAMRERVPNLPEVAASDMAAQRTLRQVISCFGVEEVSAPAAVASPSASAPAAPVRPAVRHDLSAVLLQVVAEKTGYPQEMLGLDLELEADLGVDSIKRVEILSALRERVPDLPEVSASDMAAQRTLGQIIAQLGEHSAALGGVGSEKPEPAAAVARSEVARSEVARPEMAAPPPVTSSDLAAILLAVVAEKTGYPAEMLGLDLELEADLGVDSIKRVEILSALRERVPALPEVSASDMAQLRTLGQIIARLGDVGAALPGPAPNASGARADAPTAARAPSGVQRLVVSAVRTRAPGLTLAGLLSARRIVLTDEGTGVARALSRELANAGLRAEVVEPIPADADAVVFLGGLRSVESVDEARAVNFEAFESARAVAKRFAKQRGVFVTVQDVGGDFGLTGRAPLHAWLAGIAALARTAAIEWPKASVKAIDIARGGRSAELVARALAEELLAGGSASDVGLYEDGTRITLQNVATAARAQTRPVDERSVIVVSGGARGVTASALLALAEHVPARFVLLGRTALSEEPAFCRGIVDDAGLKRALLANEKNLTPAGLRARAQTIAANREIRANLERLQAAGAVARYLGVDVQNQAELHAALAEVRRELGPITGIVHAAGVLADKLIAEKTPEQFARVFGTKVDGLSALLRATEGDPLSLLVSFSSVAARSGNSGQSDYAMANEVLNAVTAAEGRRRNGACVAKSIGWGPWQGGMVTPALEAHFAQRNIPLIPLREGGRAFVEEIESTPSEVVTVIGAELGAAASAGGAESERAVQVRVGEGSHPYLVDHSLGGKVVLPVAMVLDWLVRAAEDGRPNSSCIVRDLKVLRGIKLDRYELGGNDFTISCRAEGERSLRAELRGSDGALHYSARLELAERASPPAATPPQLSLEPWSRLEQPYDGHVLFHGPKFQMIRELEGASREGIAGMLSGARLLGWEGAAFHTDPVLIDGALQLAVLWAERVLGGATLPMSVGKYARFAPGLLEGPVRCVVKGLEVHRARTLAQIWLIDAGGRLVAELSDVETVLRPNEASAAGVAHAV